MTTRPALTWSIPDRAALGGRTQGMTLCSTAHQAGAQARPGISGQPDSGLYEVPLAVFSSIESATTTCVGTKGLAIITLFGTPCTAHASWDSPLT